MPLPTRALALIALVLASPSCGNGARERARRACTAQCQARNQTCILGAATASAVQICSVETSSCVSYCSR